MILVIGYGNTLRRDDGAGVRLAEHLADGLSARIRVETGHQLTPEMALTVAAADVDGVVFIDASVTATEIALKRIDLDNDVSPSVGHHLTPEALMVYANRLYGRTPPAWLVTLPAYDLGHGESLTDQTEAWVCAGCERVRALIAYLETPGVTGHAV